MGRSRARYAGRTRWTTKLAGFAVPGRRTRAVVTRARSNGRLTTSAEALATQYVGRLGVLIVAAVKISEVIGMLEVAEVAVDRVIGAKHLMRAAVRSVWALTEAKGILTERPKTADRGEALLTGDTGIGRVRWQYGVGDHVARAWPPRRRSTDWGRDGRRGRGRRGNRSLHAEFGFVIIAVATHVEGHAMAYHMGARTPDK